MSTQLQDAKRHEIAELAQHEPALIPIKDETTADDLRRANELFLRAYDLLGTTISQASEEGMSWREIAEITNTTRQRVAVRFRGYHHNPTPTYRNATTLLTNR